MKLLLSLALTVFALLGILDAGFITYSEFSGRLVTCKPPFACRTVLDSPWSKVGSIPLSFFGLLYYSTMLCLGILSFMDVQTISIGKFHIQLDFLIAAFGSMGMLFSLYLVFVMGVILKAWCLYCLLSAMNCGMIFLISVGLFRKESYALHI